MISWIKDTCLSFLESFSINVIKVGRIPRRIALIMDGNRRYAKKINASSAVGHGKGYDKLNEMLKWCLELGINEVTVYAFSIENFKRSKEEVDALMHLFREKFNDVLINLDDFEQRGIRVHIVGRLSFLPEDLQVLAAKVMLATRLNSKLLLNIAVAYTAQDEISRAASYIVNGVRSNVLSSDDINEELVSRTLDLKEPGLLVRTSGEVRLSDFMLWQVSDTVLYFANVLWPEISIWNLLMAIFHFQRHAPPSREVKELTHTQHEFLNQLENIKWNKIEKTAKKCVI